MWFIISGVLFGIIGGVGMGGGIVLIPVLTLFLGLSQHAAQGANLLAFLPMALCALILHAKNKRIRVKTGLIMCLSGLIGAIGGAMLVNLIPSDILRRLFGGFLILLAVYRFVSHVRLRRQKKTETSRPTGP